MKSAIPVSLDEARRSFWLLPGVGLLLGVALGLSLPAIDAGAHLHIALLSFKQPTSARTLLQTLATGAVSVGGVAFSVTVVSFQLASQQLSPRVLRTFQADRLSQSLLAALLGLFVYSLVVLARLPPRGHMMPELSLTLAVVGAVLAFALFAAFIHNIVISLQASTLIRRIAADGQRAVNAAYPAPIGFPPTDPEAATALVSSIKREQRGVEIRARRAGFLQTVQGGELLKVAQRHDALVEQQLPIGDFAVTGITVARVWARAAQDGMESDLEAAFAFGDERTVVHDVAFPIRQLADIALRGLSPALNDPTTAENAMGSLADTIVRFVRHERPSSVRCDAQGVPRLLGLAPDLGALVRLGFDQVRRASTTYPTLSRRLVTLLRHIEQTAVENEVDCAEVRHQIRLLEAALRSESEQEDPEGGTADDAGVMGERLS